jgi:hypothetical protein
LYRVLRSFRSARSSSSRVATVEAS